MLFDVPYTVLWHNFLIYAHTQTAQTGLCLPVLLSFAGLKLTGRRRPPPMTGILFLVGLIITVQFSLFFESDDRASLYCAPGCLLVLLLTPPKSRPHFGHGYALVFLGELTADLWCSARHYLEQGPLPRDFFFGIGGAGLKDGLFVYPLMAAIFLGADQWLRATERGQLTGSEVLLHLRARILALRTMRPGAAPL
jgi:hypothetical protein